MADVFTRQKRSEVMSKIRSKNTKPELRLKELLDGRVFRHQPKGITGSPDFASRKLRTAVFIDGCFWHGCPRHYNEPDQNREFWKKKISINKRRDREVSRKLRKDGWNILRVWEHSVRSSPEKVATRIIKMSRRRE